MKTILLLGGSAQQLESFDAVKRLGWRTVLCDWDPDCPGRQFADVFHAVSTIDREAVLDVARRENVDGVCSYATDAPAPIAAWVSEQLGLPGNPSDAVSMFCDKGRFREFLALNGFAVPKAVVALGEDAGRIGEIVAYVGLPLVVKPVDSSGSRGVTVVRRAKDAQKAFLHALDYSRKREIVFEGYIETRTPGKVVEAEIFVEDGKVISWGLMSALRDLSLNGTVPSCNIHPMIEDAETEGKVCETINKLIDAAGIKQGPMNIELIVDAAGDVYLIDVGPRNGGRYLPNFFSHISGEDITEATLKVAAGEPSGLSYFGGSKSGVWVLCDHYSREAGTFLGLDTTEDFERACLETHYYKNPGERVEPLSSASDAIGVSLLHFPDEHDADNVIARLPAMCRPIVDD